jgi:hypothetical protein
LIEEKALSKYHNSTEKKPKTPSLISKRVKMELSTKSNKNIVKNALMHVCLAGVLNKAVKEEVLLVIIVNIRILKNQMLRILSYCYEMLTIFLLGDSIFGILHWTRL